MRRKKSTTMRRNIEFFLCLWSGSVMMMSFPWLSFPFSLLVASMWLSGNYISSSTAVSLFLILSLRRLFTRSSLTTTYYDLLRSHYDRTTIVLRRRWISFTPRNRDKMRGTFPLWFPPSVVDEICERSKVWLDDLDVAAYSFLSYLSSFCFVLSSSGVKC